VDLLDRLQNLVNEVPGWARPPTVLSALLVVALLAQLGTVAWPPLRQGLGREAVAATDTGHVLTLGPRLSVASIISGHLFGAVEPEAGPVEKTALPLELMGTFAAADPAAGMAFLREGANAPQHLYRVGEALPGGGVLREVYRTRIVFARNGQMEELSFPERRLAFAPPPSISALGAGGTTGVMDLWALPGADDGRNNKGVVHLDTGGADGEEEVYRPPIVTKAPTPGIEDPVEDPP
jgi:hypothetical protein